MYGCETGAFQLCESSQHCLPSLTGQLPQAISPLERISGGTLPGARCSSALTSAL